MKQKDKATPVFKVYKEGVTVDGPVTIVKVKGHPFDEKVKREKYVILGYTVIELN